MSRSPLARRAACAAVALAAVLIFAPSASAAPLAGPTNLRVAAITPHSVTLAWNAATNPGSFTYVIEASFGYRLGVKPPSTTFTWTRDMVPGRTYSFVMWAGNAKGQESAKSNKLTVTLPVDRTPPAAPVVSVTGTTSSSVGLSWPAVADDDHTCCTYRVFANGTQVSLDNLVWTGERAVTVLRLAAATTHSFSVVAVDPSRNVSAPSAAVTATTQPTSDTTGPSAPGNLIAWDFGLRDLALLGQVGRRRRPAGVDSLRGLRERRPRRQPDQRRPLDHLRDAELEHVLRPGDRQRRQPFCHQLCEARQPGLLSP